MNDLIIDDVIREFFQTNDSRSVEIGRKLLIDGECIVPYKLNNIFVYGHIREFIYEFEEYGLVDCYKYKLDPEFFISDVLKQFLNNKKGLVLDEINNLGQDLIKMKMVIDVINDYTK
jgi:hypothetical protein